MDVDQLKLILETLHDAGTGAFIFGVLWIVKGFLTPVLCVAIAATVVVKLIHAIRDGVKHSEDAATRREELKTEDPLMRWVAGRLDMHYNSYLSSSDKDAIKNAIKNAIEAGITLMKAKKP